MRHLLLVVPLLLGPIASAIPVQAQTQLSIGISSPGVQIGINMPSYPQLVRVPGYPVYYAPQARSNYFFYDGLYWVYQDDNWYSSDWYNGPWHAVGPQYVPLYVLRVPVRYYRQPPTYFRGWRPDAAPRWNEHWGRDWEQQRSGWDRWDRRSVPAPAPLPSYQRPYSGARYPSVVEQQHDIRSQNYRYRPHEPISQQHYQQAPAPQRAQPDRPQAEPRNRGQEKKAEKQDKDKGNGKGKDDRKNQGDQK